MRSECVNVFVTVREKLKRYICTLQERQRWVRLLHSMWLVSNTKNLLTIAMYVFPLFSFIRLH